VPAVSVIVPAYNVAAYVRAALESVLAQTFTDLEVLVVDDGSTDETPAIAAEFCARDARFRLIQQDNRGLAGARNRALGHAAGEFFALLDSDDVWDPRFVEEQIAIMRARPDVSIVTGNARFLGSRLDGLAARPYPDTRPDPDLALILGDEEAVFIMSVFRRTVYEGIGGFDETMRTNEDYDYWIRAAAAGFIFARNDRPLGCYRRRDDSLSASEERMLRGILRVYAKAAPLVADRPRERAIVERQVERFEQQLLRAEARTAIETSDFRRAVSRLEALQARSPAVSIAVARMMAQWTPSLLARAYKFRRQRQLAGHATPQLP
jgi:glycosyltransferase involved in cell wall biosynthesis